MDMSPAVTQHDGNFVTVVTVGTTKNEPNKPKKRLTLDDSEFVTVLRIGGTSTAICIENDVYEEVLVYRLPGERLGFGLKFEGGTKANEFIKRLFIQSCSVDSPASRVRSSWGRLVEGDEVLEIDNHPVNVMTRIDCVKCLKESTVVIKLLLRHFYQKPNNTDSKQCNGSRTRSSEDLPQVVSAEIKRNVPPPPPVPPRKIPRKIFRNNYLNQSKEYSSEAIGPSPAIRQKQLETVENKKSITQNPYRNMKSFSPDIPRRQRKYSDSSYCPPDAEVYLDLFSQESMLSLSESDDTASTVSTVIDRTTASSLAGSLPSTPTTVQRHLDLSNILISLDDEDVTTTHKVASKRKSIVFDEKLELTNNKINDQHQTPSCFQDASLSYGNEYVRAEKHLDESDFAEQVESAIRVEYNKGTYCMKPPIPPRSKNLSATSDLHKKLSNHSKDENMNILSLPRLVDFLPKSFSKFDDIKENEEFLDNERMQNYVSQQDLEENACRNVDFDALDEYPKWSAPPQLATIGEVEEESNKECVLNRLSSHVAPIVIVEHAIPQNYSSFVNTTEHSPLCKIEIYGRMEILPSDHRQPPDGHEFPDYEEVFKSSKKIIHSGPKSYHTNFELNKDVTQETHDQTENSVVPGLRNFNHENSSFNDRSTEASSLNKLSSLSNSDLCAILRSKDCNSLEENKNRNNESLPKLHTRSQSLCDITAFNQRQTEHWTTLAEQRKKGLSKLKGLVIPEPISETEIACAINIPEITSTIIGPIEPVNKQAYFSGASSNPSHIENVKVPLTSPPWSENVSAIPKYSPAFKRKPLQVYNSTPIKYEYINSPSTEKQPFVKKSNVEDSYSETMSFLQASKSLEGSPTRSDYSFEYVSPHNRSIISNNGFHHDSIAEQFALGNCKNEKDLNMLDDESDNDSAVSSSQCSFISRPSPPPSPNRSCDSLEYETTPNRNVIREHNRRYSGECRHLKASSIEAINRKNILASAKCRSGKDLKVGSPVINRKLEIEEPSKKSELITDLEKPTISHNNKLDMLHKVNKAFVNVDSAGKEMKKDTPSVVAEENPVNEKNNSNGAKFAMNESFVNTNTQVRRPSMESKVPSSIPQLKNKTPQKVGQVLKYNKSLSVNDLRKNFEDFGKSPAPVLQKIVPSKHMPVKKTTKSEEVPTSKTHVEKEYNGEKNKKGVVEPSKVIKRTKPNTITITLHPETPGGSLGITLGGGTDYEIKQITVHRIRFGSVAYQEGTLTKGDHIISINGNLTEGLTHGEAVEFLKEPLKEVTLHVERGSNDSIRQEISEKRKSSILDNLLKPSSSREQKIANHTFLIQKGGAGLGFSMEGGKDSLDGDVPLVVKRIFPGGAAEKDGRLLIGDEIVAINDICFRNLSRMQAWTLMKKLPEGIISLHIFR